MSPNSRVPLQVRQLAERGARMFPLAPDTKIPFKGWYWKQRNTSDPQELEEYAREVELREKEAGKPCNWAMTCGRPSGQFLMDIDAEGMPWYLDKLNKYGVEWVNTLRVRSPKGVHDHFYCPKDFEVGCRDGAIAPGIDIKGNGGYAVMPPSRVSGKAYTFEDCDVDKELLDPPDWLVAELRRIFVLVREQETNKSETEQPVNGKPLIAGKIPSGKNLRHGLFKREALRFCKAGIHYDGLLAHFRAINRELFAEPYPDEEVIRQAKSWYEWAREKIGTGFKPDVHSAGRLITKPYSEFTPEPLDWIWPPYVPKGTMTLLTGDPGAGKSYIALWLAAKMTKEGKNVIYFTIENSVSKISLPRFLSLGGDPRLMHHVNGIQFAEVEDDRLRRVMLADIPIIEEEIRRLNGAFVIIDPLQSYLGQNVDSNQATKTRPVLDGVLEMTERLNTEAIINRHGRKDTVSRIMNKGLGTIDFTAAARSEIVAGTTPERERAMIHTKNNLGPLGPTMGYEINAISPEGMVCQGGYFAWTGERPDIKPADLQAPERSGEEEGVQSEAERFLLDMLLDGPKLSSDVKKAARQVDIAEITLRRARVKLGVKWRKRFGDGRIEWYLDRP